METTTDTTTPPAKRAARRVPAEKTALKSLCSQLRIEPKVARRKLRAAKFSWHGSRERWVMTPAQLERAREILKPSKKPATPKADA